MANASKNPTTALVNVPATPLAAAWARDPGKHPMDSYLEDAGAMAVQGITDTREDKSIRLVPGRRSDGTRVITLVAASHAALDECAEVLSSEDGYDLERKRVRRPPEDVLNQIIQELPAHGIVTPGALAGRELRALPPATASDRDVPHLSTTTGDPPSVRPPKEPIARLPTRHAAEPIAPLPAQYARGIVEGRPGVQGGAIADERPRLPFGAGVRSIEPEPGRPFVLRIRQGRRVVDEAGPFTTITAAMEARDERGAPGQRATIYNRASIAEYRGGQAIFSFGRRKWSRSDG